MSSASNVETEVKLRVDLEEIARLRASPWWRALEDPKTKELTSAYFDTPKKKLRQLGVSLRTRNKDDAIVQTVKLSDAEGGSYQRREWSAVIPDSIPDPALVIDPDLPKEFRKLTAADLAQVFSVEVRRETRLLNAETGSIELALDDGVVVSNGKRTSLHELELELLSGDASVLVAEARRIVDIAGGRLHMRTKAQRGYDLFDEKQALWSKGGPLFIDKDADAGEAFQSVLKQCLEHLTANDDCARRDAHVEGVHQCRVALRRMRTALRLYREALPVEPFRTLESEVKWLASSLGPARDLDVLYNDLLAPAVSALDAPEDVAPLLAALRRQRNKAYAEASAVIGSARYGRLLIDLFSVATNDDWRAKGDRPRLKAPAREFAKAALETVRNKTLKRGRGFKKLSIPQRHEVRLAVKKMRYTADFFSSLYGAKKTKRFGKRLAGLQDGLGSLNDVAVAENLLAKLIDGAVAEAGAEKEAMRADLSYASGCVLGWHRRRASVMNAKLEDEWKTFKTADPFWA